MSSVEEFLNKYIDHPNFKKVKEEYILKYGYNCCICGADEMLELHHKTYNMPPGCETIDDVELLCTECHTTSHITIEKIREYKKQFNAIVTNLINKTLYKCLDKERVIKDKEYRHSVIDGFTRAHSDRIDFLISKSGMRTTESAVSTAYADLKRELEKEIAEKHKKQIIELYYKDKKRPSEIAKIVGVSKSTVHRRIDEYYNQIKLDKVSKS